MCKVFGNIFIVSVVVERYKKRTYISSVCFLVVGGYIIIISMYNFWFLVLVFCLFVRKGTLL